MTYCELMMRVYIDQCGWDDGRTWKAKARQDAGRNYRRPAPRLCPGRISVEQDGSGVVQQCFGVTTHPLPLISDNSAQCKNFPTWANLATAIKTT